MDDEHLEELIAFLHEDLGRGDATSAAVVPEETHVRAVVNVGEEGVLAGLEEATALAASLDLSVIPRAGDGDQIGVGQLVCEIDGPARGILGVERTFLNLLSHLSGVATLTRSAVRAVTEAHTGARSSVAPRISATRKTLPGLRRLQKKAVVIGGGLPHRNDLSDAILVKDNHLLVNPDIDDVVRRAKARAGGMTVEIEVESVADALTAARAGADQLLLDNLGPEGVVEVFEKLEAAGLRDAVELEASGGIRLATVAAYADTGVDMISMGVLTSGAHPIDFSLHLTA